MMSGSPFSTQVSLMRRATEEGIRIDPKARPERVRKSRRFMGVFRGVWFGS
jgi:hypothetical protein